MSETPRHVYRCATCGAESTATDDEVMDLCFGGFYCQHRKPTGGSNVELKRYVLDGELTAYTTLPPAVMFALEAARG